MACRSFDFDGTVAPDDPTDRLLDRFAAPRVARHRGRVAGGADDIAGVHDAAGGAAAGDAAPARCGNSYDPDRSGLPRIPRPLPPARHRRDDRLGRLRPGCARRAPACRPAASFYCQHARMAGRRPLASRPATCPRTDFRSGAANCKCAHGTPGSACVVVGNGRSDFCMAVRARFVIAKGALADFCRARGLAHASFRNFDDATLLLAEWLICTPAGRRTHASRCGVRAGPKPGLNGLAGREPGV